MDIAEHPESTLCGAPTQPLRKQEEAVNGHARAELAAVLTKRNGARGNTSVAVPGEELPSEEVVMQLLEAAEEPSPAELQTLSGVEEDDTALQDDWTHYCGRVTSVPRLTLIEEQELTTTCAELQKKWRNEVLSD